MKGGARVADRFLLARCVAKRRRTLLVFGVVLAILLVAGVAVVLSIDSFATAAVRRGATRALGVETHLRELDVGLLGGALDLQELRVENPAAFDGDTFLRLGRGRASIDVGSLFTDVVELRDLTLDDLELWLEQDGARSNWGTILAHVREMEEGEDAQAGETRVRVGRLVLTGVRATIRARLPGTAPVQLAVPIDEIELEGLGAGESLPIARITAIVVKAVIAAVLENAGGQLPAEVAAALRLAMDPLESLEQLGVRAVVQGADVLRGVVEGAARRTLEQAIPGLGTKRDVDGGRK